MRQRNGGAPESEGRYRFWRFGSGVVVVLIASALVAGLVWFVASQARQPVYRGKPLSVWLRTYAPSAPYQLGSREWRETDAELRTVGTNSVSLLLRMIRATDSKLKLELVALARKQQVIKIQFVPATDKNIEASRAFVVLGETAKGAVPGLMKAYDENVSVESRRAIVDALAWIGPSAKPAVPLLLQAATNSDLSIRANALWALGDIHAQPEVCVPVLIRALESSVGSSRLSAAHALGRFGADGRPAIRQLTEMAKAAEKSRARFDDHISEMLEARNALRKIGPGVETLPEFDLPTWESPFSPQ